MAKDFAETAVEGIIEDLNDRSGLSLDGVDEETQAEIRALWAQIIREAYECVAAPGGSDGLGN